MHYSDPRLYKLSWRTKRRLAVPGPVGATIGLQVLPEELAYLAVRSNPTKKPAHLVALRLEDVDREWLSLEALTLVDLYFSRGGTVELLGRVLERAADRNETLSQALDALYSAASFTMALLPPGTDVVLEGLEAASAEISLPLDDEASFPAKAHVIGWAVELPDGADAWAACVSNRRARISPWLLARDPKLLDALKADLSRRLSRGLGPIEAAAELVSAACGSTTAGQAGGSR
jgi:hypothetical protein